MKIGKNHRFVMIGDSITDCGRAQPVAEGAGESMGRGYASMVSSMIMSACPELAIRVFNVGKGGNTIRDLDGRWDTDVIALKPDWLSVLIGINDVWRQFDNPLVKEIHVLPEEYERRYDALLARTRPNLKGLVLMAPYFLEPRREDAMRAQMDRYGQIVRKLAERHDATFVDLQAAFEPLLKHAHPMAIAWDRVHPNQAGHMTIARALAGALEVPVFTHGC